MSLDQEYQEYLAQAAVHAQRAWSTSMKHACCTALRSASALAIKTAFRVQNEKHKLFCAAERATIVPLDAFVSIVSFAVSLTPGPKPNIHQIRQRLWQKPLDKRVTLYQDIDAEDSNLLENYQNYENPDLTVKRSKTKRETSEKPRKLRRRILRRRLASSAPMMPIYSMSDTPPAASNELIIDNPEPKARQRDRARRSAAWIKRHLRRTHAE